VDEDDGRARAGFLVVEFDLVVGHGIRHRLGPRWVIGVARETSGMAAGDKAFARRAMVAG